MARHAEERTLREFETSRKSKCPFASLKTVPDISPPDQVGGCLDRIGNIRVSAAGETGVVIGSATEGNRDETPFVNCKQAFRSSRSNFPRFPVGIVQRGGDGRNRPWAGRSCGGAVGGRDFVAVLQAGYRSGQWGLGVRYRRLLSSTITLRSLEQPPASHRV